MTDDEPLDPKGGESGGRFRSRANKESALEIQSDVDQGLSKTEAKAMRNLARTLEAMRASLNKGRLLVGLGEQRFDEDWIVQDAAINIVVQLAEDAKRLPKSFKEERPEIAWHKVVGMRNIVTHEYATVDPLIVWAALEHDFPTIARSVFGDEK